MSVSTQTNDSISDLTGYCVYADAIFGGNGDTGGVPSYDCGTDSDDVYGYIDWDDDLSDGLDSGVRALSFAALEGGGSNGVQWSVEGGSAGTLQFTDQTYGAITQVQIRAAVTIVGVTCTLSGIVLKFYKSGSLVETITLSSSQNPVADTTGDGAPDQREQITTVTPTNSDNDKLEITGNIRLQAEVGVDPGPTDLQAQIYVYTDSCGE